MNDALFGADPSQLAVGDEVAPGLAPVFNERRECLAFEAVGDLVDGGADDVVSSTNSECLGSWGISKVRGLGEDGCTYHAMALVLRIGL